MELVQQCIECGISEEVANLERCRMCYRYFCPDCGHRMRGAVFCSDGCAAYYVYGDSDEDEAVVDD